MTPSHDKRRAPREPRSNVLEVSDESGRLITGVVRMVDVSHVGASFTASETLQVGQRLRGRIKLLRRGPFDVSGTIVWAKKREKLWQYGLQFDLPNEVLPDPGEQLGGTL